MTATAQTGVPTEGGQPPFTFQLSSRNDQVVPRFHAMMMDPGNYRISLVAVPGYTAFQYTNRPGRWITEFYLYRPCHTDPEIGISEFLSNRNRSNSPEEAFRKFEPRVISIPGDFPLPVMFCIADAQHRDNQGGLTVRVERL